MDMAASNYNKLKKKYGLPEASKLMERLEIEIEKDGGSEILLQTLRNQVTDKLFDLMKVLESILFTGEGSDPSLLYQEHIVEDVSKQGLGLYKIFNELHYHGLKLRFRHDRKSDGDFIKKVYNIWPGLEEKLFVFFEKLENGWKEIDIEKEIKAETYHG